MSARNRSGFSLIEILVAMGAFILVFLTGSGGLMRLMMQQTNNQQSTIAASAAMMLADWHATIALAALPTIKDIPTTLTTGSNIIATVSPCTTASIKASVKFKGSAPDSGETFYTFKSTAVWPNTTPTIDLSAYGNLCFSLTPAAAGSTGSMKFRVITFWYGDPTSISTATVVADTFVFVGRYLLPESY